MSVSVRSWVGVRCTAWARRSAALGSPDSDLRVFASSNYRTCAYGRWLNMVPPPRPENWSSGTLAKSATCQTYRHGVVLLVNMKPETRTFGEAEFPDSIASLREVGQEQRSSTHSSFEVRNPFSNHLVGRAASSADCLAATIDKTPPTARAAIVLKAADLSASAEYTEKLAAALKAELVAPDFVLARDPKGSVASAREYATAIVQLKSEPPSRVPGRSASVVVQRRAMGVM
ncbi:uncharacterized protein C8Q71DRAFT_890745 [Rhodofomes roseus]|uniref:Uncharacterized protein n=1 Tax=Rhodofomes roseus TaxID=34475 RepID=A0ABQ8KT25_9APHY|nr:uncharacterized protein C8Q71DRAFT_890745 [Rhodofomes roseus]KAH9841074.1 hypothetical protein C8Q71DRAFT_890745 [Rhodofomes roseus]